MAAPYRLRSMQARYYDPVIGRFLSINPVNISDNGNPLYFNRYAYVGNNPINMWDPNGEQAVNTNKRCKSRSCQRELLKSVGADDQTLQLYDRARDNHKFFALGGPLMAVPGPEDAALATIAASRAGQAILNAGSKIAGAVKGALDGSKVNNPVPDTLARVVPGDVSPSTLGRPGDPDVFVTASDDIAGMNSSQISEALAIPESSSGFNVIEFPSSGQPVASPVNRSNPGFVGKGRTAGGAREFVVPNQRIPDDATTRRVD